MTYWTAPGIDKKASDLPQLLIAACVFAGADEKKVFEGRKPEATFAKALYANIMRNRMTAEKIAQIVKRDRSTVQYYFTLPDKDFSFKILWEKYKKALGV